MADQQFCLRWNRHQSTLISVLDTLLENDIFVDCTLAAEGQFLKAHRVVLSACSPYFQSLLSQHFARHPIIIIKDMKLSELKSLLDYMYRGEVNISQDQLGPFLKAAESLQIKGICEHVNNMDASYNSTPEPVESSIIAQEGTATRRVVNGESKSPPRKRKKGNAYSSTDQSANFNISSSRDFPNRCQSIPNVSTSVASLANTPSAEINITVVPAQSGKGDQIKTPNVPSPFGSSLSIEKIEPFDDEYLKEIDADASVEDLTLEDDDEGGDNISYSSNNPSITSHRELEPWETGSIKSETDEVHVATQECAGAGTSSQGLFGDGKNFQCLSCGKKYKHKKTLVRHQRYECGDIQPFACSLCAYTSKQKSRIKLHMISNHSGIKF